MAQSNDENVVFGSGGPKMIIVMGVSGSGKSTTAQNLARALNVPFEDGDDLHPPENVAKMSRGEPLTDADRAPWLRLIRERGTELTQREGKSTVVIACAATTVLHHPEEHSGHQEETTNVETYVANTTPPLKTYFVFIKGRPEVILNRMQKRKGHFMKASMLESQLATLEDPTGEDGVVVVDLEANPEEQCKQAVEGLKSLGS
ncbi:thermoresistant gluconokinase [Ceratobasidium sp. AG-Ba]|nr:thermoresistant gluconokinase [Ceratobasidium sp. AG-Ba]